MNRKTMYKLIKPTNSYIIPSLAGQQEGSEVYIQESPMELDSEDKPIPK
jgi:hypothetical protein